MLDRRLLPLIGAATLLAPSTTTAIAATFGVPGCGLVITSPGGPPSISATEVSTSQALELVRQRRLQVAEACPAGTISVNGICQPAAQPASFSPPPPPTPAVAAPQPVAGGPASAAASAKGAAPGAAKQRAAKAPPSGAKAPSAAYEQSAASATTGTIYGSWGEVFLDFEWHDNVAPGQAENPDRRQRTVGYLSGLDMTNRRGAEGFQIGVLSGYMDTENKFSDTQSSFTQAASTIVTTTSGARQSMEGHIIGGYLAYFAGPFSADLLGKVDILDFEQSGTVTETASSTAGCFAPTTVVTSLAGTTSVTNFTVASNINYKIDLGGGRWFEPTIGMRYTFSDYDSDAVLLGLDDGHMMRIQGGARIGSTGIVGGAVVTVSLTGLLYSDVVIDGFLASSAGLPASVVTADEGKLRAMGILQGRVSQSNGMSYYGQAEVRGGEDVIGIGGKVGMRYEW